MDRRRNPSVGTTVSGGVVSVRINAYSPSREQALAELERTAEQCKQRLGDLIYGQEEQTLADVVAAALRQSRRTVATAESCTGGLVAKYLTDIPGSSAYFLAGWVTYSNVAKVRDLGVSEATLAAHGAVSDEVVREMAAGARAESGADYALAISGVAGPDGGTEAKPVGMVCIALASPSNIDARTFRMFGDREMIRDRSAKMALMMLRFSMMGKAMPI
jgi:nicotinamide-nucleotide amidase